MLLPEKVMSPTFAKKTRLSGVIQGYSGTSWSPHRTLTKVVLWTRTCAEDVMTNGDDWTLAIVLPTKSTA